MRRALAAAAAAGLLAMAGCSSDSGAIDLTHSRPPGPSQVEVDTPDLEALRAKTGMPDCQPGPGGELPSLTLPCLGGGTSVDLASLRGPMVLNFWGSWCGPCRAEMPELEAFHQAYGDRVPVLGIDWQDQFPGSALEQIQRRGVTYPSLADPGGETQQLAEFAKVPGMPMTYLIDAQGEIAYVKAGQLDSEAELADLVQTHLGVDL